MSGRAPPGPEALVDAVVPASGRSTRMGSPKPLLDAGGRSFLQRVVGCLSRGGCRRALVVVRDTEGPIAAMARRAGAEVLANPDPEEGPVTSLRVGLRALGDDAAGCAYHPVDHPLVEAETVARLLEAFRSAGAPVTVPTHGGRRGHPAIFHRALFHELLEEGLEEGARTVVRRHDDALREVPVDDGGVLADIDTLREYRRRFPDAYRKRFQSR